MRRSVGILSIALASLFTAAVGFAAEPYGTHSEVLARHQASYPTMTANPRQTAI